MICFDIFTHSDNGYGLISEGFLSLLYRAIEFQIVILITLFIDD